MTEEKLLPDEESTFTQKEMINQSEEKLNDASETCLMVKLVQCDWQDLRFTVGQSDLTVELTWDFKNELKIGDPK